MRADAAPSWLLLHGLSAVGGELELPSDEAHYLTRVCRVLPGERVTATDGQGRVASLEVLATGARVRARVVSVEIHERTSAATLWCGAPEGERADWLVEKLAELSIAAFQPVDFERGKWQRARSRSERWRKLAVAALRQSRQAFLMGVLEPRPFAELLEALPQATPILLASEGGRPAKAPPAGPCVGVVGPAAGLDRSESEMLERRGAVAQRLAPARLRTETAAVAWASLWAAGATDPGFGAP